jgi:hypothetical protein
VLVPVRTQKVVRLRNVAVLFAAYPANIERASEMLVGGVILLNFDALFDWYDAFDAIYSFSLPRLGAARLQESKAPNQSICKAR